jgi:hypothetical protein
VLKRFPISIKIQKSKITVSIEVIDAEIISGMFLVPIPIITGKAIIITMRGISKDLKIVRKLSLFKSLFDNGSVLSHSKTSPFINEAVFIIPNIIRYTKHIPSIYAIRNSNIYRKFPFCYILWDVFCVSYNIWKAGNKRLKA